MFRYASITQHGIWNPWQSAKLPLSEVPWLTANIAIMNQRVSPKYWDSSIKMDRSWPCIHPNRRETVKHPNCQTNPGSDIEWIQLWCSGHIQVFFTDFRLHNKTKKEKHIQIRLGILWESPWNSVKIFDFHFSSRCWSPPGFPQNHLPCPQR